MGDEEQLTLFEVRIVSRVIIILIMLQEAAYAFMQFDLQEHEEGLPGAIADQWNKVIGVTANFICRTKEEAGTVCADCWGSYTC